MDEKQMFGLAPGPTPPRFIDKAAFDPGEKRLDLFPDFQRGPAEANLKRRFFWATHSRPEPVIEAAKTIRRLRMAAHRAAHLHVPRQGVLDVGEARRRGVVRGNALLMKVV